MEFQVPKKTAKKYKMGNPETVRQGANCELKKQDKSMVISQKKQLFEIPTFKHSNCLK